MEVIMNYPVHIVSVGGLIENNEEKIDKVYRRIEKYSHVEFQQHVKYDS